MAVLVAYDGSDPAQRAVEHAVEKYPDEELVLLRVVEVAGGMLEAGFNLVKESISEREDELHGRLSAEVREIIDTDSVDFRAETAVGPPAREIVEFAEANDVDHIVIGSHGREGVSRVLLGSVAEKVVRRAPMTVTVVR